MQTKTLDNPDLVSLVLQKTLSREERIARVEAMVHRKISKKISFVMDKAFELAAGIEMIDMANPEHPKYYTKAPNLDAIIYLIDRLIGKPTSREEHKDTTERKGVQAVQNIIIQLANQSIKKNEHDTTGNGIVTVSSHDVRSGSDAVQK